MTRTDIKAIIKVLQESYPDKFFDSTGSLSNEARLWTLLVDKFADTCSQLNPSLSKEGFTDMCFATKKGEGA